MHAVASPPFADVRPVVLYVEDHPVNTRVMQALLDHRPMLRLVIATTGEEGLQAARVEGPDLLLLDDQLPDCDGIELLRALRQLDGLREVPAVVVSEDDDGSRFADTARCEVWPKPLDIHAALQAIDRLTAQPAH